MKRLTILLHFIIKSSDSFHPQETDRLRLVCLAVLCELSVANSNLFVACGGVCVLTRSLLDTSMARIAEAVLGSLLRKELLNYYTLYPFLTSLKIFHHFLVAHKFEN